MEDKIKHLIEQLEDDSPDPMDEDAWIERRIEAAISLAKYPSSLAFESLSRALNHALHKDEELSLSWYVIEALGALRDDRAENLIRPLLEHEDIDVRKSAIKALMLLQKE